MMNVPKNFLSIFKEIINVRVKNKEFSSVFGPQGCYFQLAWPQFETQQGQNSAWAKATTAFIFMCVCVCVCVSDKASVPFLKIIFTHI